MRTFNSIDSVYFVYSLNDKTQNMSYYEHKGLAEVAVNSNILRNTDDRLYVGTASGLRAYNSDGTYTTMANMANYHPIFISTPIVINPWVLLARTTIYQQQTGKKVYELKDHLGNVRATITDRKFLTLTGTDPKYKAELVTATDYYAYGSPMKGRIYTTQTGSYRFGFNTQEKVDEVSGDGNHNTALFWEYDTRLGRRWNRDPKPNPSISDYVCFGNNPILNSDLLGDTLKVDKNSTDKFKEKSDKAIEDLKSTPEGLKMYNNLQNSPQVFTLREAMSGEKNSFIADDETVTNSETGETTTTNKGGTIIWDGEGELVPVQKREKSTLSRPSSDANMSLFHEMGHAEDQALGVLTKMDANMINGISEAEWSACHKENVLRAERNMPLRVSYRKTEKGKAIPPLLIKWRPRGIESVYKKGFMYITF